MALVFALVEINHNPLVLKPMIEPEMILNTQELDTKVPYPIDITYSKGTKK